MHDFLSERAGQLQRLATTIRTGLDQAESAIPSINQQLAELARLGMSDFQIEGPTIYCRPMGFSSMHGDEWVIYQAAIVMPGGKRCQHLGRHRIRGALQSPLRRSGRPRSAICYVSGLPAAGASHARGSCQRNARSPDECLSIARLVALSL